MSDVAISLPMKDITAYLQAKGYRFWSNTYQKSEDGKLLRTILLDKLEDNISTVGVIHYFRDNTVSYDLSMSGKVMKSTKAIRQDYTKGKGIIYKFLSIDNARLRQTRFVTCPPDEEVYIG